MKYTVMYYPSLHGSPEHFDSWINARIYVAWLQLYFWGTKEIRLRENKIDKEWIY